MNVRLLGLATAGIIAVASSRPVIASQPNVCEPGSSFAADNAAVVAPAHLHAGRLDDVLIHPDAFTSIALNGQTGSQLWKRDLTIPAEQLVNAYPPRNSALENGTILEITANDTSDCEQLETSVLDAQSALQARSEMLGVTRLPGETRSNIFSNLATDLNGDGIPDPLVEERAYGRDGFVGSQYTTWEGRDSTPVAMRGEVIAVDGSTGSQLLRMDKALSVGPGPLAGYFSVDDKSAVVAILDGSATSDGVESHVEARTTSGLLWRSTVQLLPQPWTYLNLARGPAFATIELQAVGAANNFTIPLTEGLRLTVLDSHTGQVAWKLEWDQPNQPELFAVGGDLMIDDWSHGTLEKRKGADGSLIWRVRYAVAGSSGGTTALDQDGDGITDYLITLASGPVVFSGATGAPTWRPVYLAGTETITPVPDLNADGKDDIITTATVDTPAGQGSTEVCAFEGSDGELLWKVLLPPPIPTQAATQVHVVSGHLDDEHTRNVVVFRGTGDVTALSGTTGSQLWHESA